jgi:hypothetical protein
VDDVEPIDQVLAEVAGGSESEEVAVRGRHHTDVEARLGWSVPTAWISRFSRKRRNNACRRIRALDHSTSSGSWSAQREESGWDQMD